MEMNADLQVQDKKNRLGVFQDGFKHFDKFV